MHLSFLLDLSTDDCDCSFIYDNFGTGTPAMASPPMRMKACDVAKKLLPTPRKSSTSSSSAVSFKGVMEGLPLTMEGVCQIYQLIHFLGRTTEHLRVEGLFRKHGKYDILWPVLLTYCDRPLTIVVSDACTINIKNE